MVICYKKLKSKQRTRVAFCLHFARHLTFYTNTFHKYNHSRDFFQSSKSLIEVLSSFGHASQIWLSKWSIKPFPTGLKIHPLRNLSRVKWPQTELLELINFPSKVCTTHNNKTIHEIHSSFWKSVRILLLFFATCPNEGIVSLVGENLSLSKCSTCGETLITPTHSLKYTNIAQLTQCVQYFNIHDI